MVMCIALMACTAFGAAEPREASLCDVWPLAAGNSWVLVPSGAEGGSGISVLAQGSYNGYMTWTMIFYSSGIISETTRAYWMFVDGWLYETLDVADLATLPEIVGGMHRVLPEVFRDGETFTHEAFFGSGPQRDLTPVVSDEGVRLYSAGREAFFPLTRGIGPCIPSRATIVGTCSNLPQTTISVSPSQWAEVGQTLRLTVPESSGSGFQWYKNGAPIQGATTSAYVIAAAELEDSGSYKCRISDAPKASYDTRTVTVTVFPQGSLPVAGTAGLAVLALVLAAMSSARIRNARQR